MDLAAITMERNEARRAFLDYRNAVRAQHSKEDEQIMRGYKALSQGHQVINLTETIEKAGTKEFTTVDTVWQGHKRVRRMRAFMLPAFAIGRADQPECWLRTESDGRLLYSSEKRPAPNAVHNVRRVQTTWDNLPSTWEQWVSMTPIIPPALRPPHALSGYHIIWEAEWEVRKPPAPRDPALLKHIGGDLYAVLAVWDLTPLERAVLAGGRNVG